MIVDPEMLKSNFLCFSGQYCIYKLIEELLFQGFLPCSLIFRCNNFLNIWEKLYIGMYLFLINELLPVPTITVSLFLHSTSVSIFICIVCIFLLTRNHWC